MPSTKTWPTRRRHVYSEREHDETLRQHERRYDDMKRTAKAFGRDSAQYKLARDLMVEAMRLVRVAARRPRRRV